ncbi:MAG: Z1 domain-containing protein [Candidatus Limnocylindria bacterium]
MTNDDRRERAHTDALRTAMAILQSQDPITDEIVGQAVAGATASIVAMRAVYGEINLDTERLRRQIEERVTVWTATQSALSDDRDHVPWLAAERAGIEWRFWERYRAFIADDLPPAAVRQVHNITDDILGRLESPRRDGAWDRRGMVVGQVQSGKTANYTGLICKAADAGYRLIIVLAGMHDSLRSQTQERLDEGFLGWDTQYGHTHKDGSRSHRTGVGAMVQNAKLLPVNTFTSSAPKGDFKRQIAQQVAPHIGSDPVVLVVKKHKTILENVIAWTTREKLRGPDGRELVMGQSLLVIDDEADNASVNTKEIERELDADGELTSETDPATINRLIRQLLNSFEQSAYVGYTATPFANIFIFEDEKHGRYGEDLFPRSFIVRIPPPSNYVGAPRVFGLPAAETPDGVAVRGLPVIRDVDDTDAFIENRTDKNEQIGPLPPSLREAVHAFVLTCAARAARGQGQKHCSMLVHVTRFVLVQSQVTDALREEMQRIQQRLRHGDGDRRDTVIDRLRELWDRDFEATFAKLEEADRGTPIDWDDICRDEDRGPSRQRILGRRADLQGPPIHGTERHRRGRRQALTRAHARGSGDQLLPTHLEDVRHAAADGALVRLPTRLPRSLSPLHHARAGRLVPGHHGCQRGAQPRIRRDGPERRNPPRLRPQGTLPPGRASGNGAHEDAQRQGDASLLRWRLPPDHRI